MNVGTGPKAQFFPNLEAARGIAALMVALFHIGQAYFFNSAGLQRTLIAPAGKTLEFTWSDQLFRILGNGPGAVVLFFVLSGFVLTLVLQQGADRGEIALLGGVGQRARLHGRGGSHQAAQVKQLPGVHG